MHRLKRENAALMRANAILKAASAFFAAKLDRPGLWYQSPPFRGRDLDLVDAVPSNRILNLESLRTP